MGEKTVVSHTLVKNGMPFIEPVLRNVEPFMNRMLVTISEKSDDGTLNVLRKLEREFPKKVRIYFENVESPGELTKERQKQVENTLEDWILFLDDDDWWPKESLEEIVKLLDKDVDGYSVTPYQAIDENTHDAHWLENRSFTKWFKNVNINYRHPWPRDMIYSGDKSLYWKHNPRIVKLKGKFFHLSHIKNDSFRTRDWAKEFIDKINNLQPYPDEVKKYVWEIFNWKAMH